MNTELLIKVRDRIDAEPMEFEMVYFFNQRIYHGGGSELVPACRTAACIAGHALAINAGESAESAACAFQRFYPYDIWASAMKVLGLERGASDRLFHARSWPAKFRGNDLDDFTKREQADLAVARINHFIATEGRE